MYVQYVFLLNLVDLGFDEEELDECRCAVDSSVDVVQSQAGLAYEVKVLGQEILYPQQGGGGLLLPIIYIHIQHKSHWTRIPPALVTINNNKMKPLLFDYEETLTIFIKHSTAF